MLSRALELATQIASNSPIAVQSCTLTLRSHKVGWVVCIVRTVRRRHHAMNILLMCFLFVALCTHIVVFQLHTWIGYLYL